MPSYTPEKVKRDIDLYNKLLTQRITTEQTWQAMANLMRPIRIDVRARRSPGQQQTQYVFDGTAIKAQGDLASALSGSMTSVDYQWFTLRMGLEELNDDWETRSWLEDCAKRIYLAFQQSNFGAEMNELYQDLIVFGTGCMWMDERAIRSGAFNGFIFKTIAPGRYVFMEDKEGRPNRVMTELTLTGASVAEKFGVNAMSSVTKAKYEKSPEEPITILRIVQPVEGGEGRKRFELVWHELDQKHYLGGQYLRRLRCLVPRWEKASEEVYGRGRGHVAFPDTATLNRAVELRLRHWAKAVDPPVLTVDDGVIGKLRLMSGTRTMVRNTEAVKPFDSGAKFDVANFQEEQIRVAIRNYFYADQLQLPTKQYMTAYEIASHVEMMQRLLGPTIGRLKDELFNPLIDYAFDSMMMTGMLPPPPPLVIAAAQAGHTDINVMYTSPLTRTQRANELGALQQVIAGNQALIANDPALMDNFNGDVTLRDSAMDSGVPARWLASPQARDEKRQARIEAQRQMQEMALKEQAAKTTGMMTKAATDLAALPPDQEGVTMGSSGG